MARSVLLVGGGHAHVRVLSALGRAPLVADVALLGAEPVSVYTGMVPGVIAGQYGPDQAQIDVASLAARSGVRFIHGRAKSLDAAERRVALEDGRSLEYDLLSLDVGAAPREPDVVDPGATLIRVKPIERAVVELERALRSLPRPCRVVVVGAGAGGAELSLCLAARLGGAGEVSTCDAGQEPVAERGSRVSRLVGDAFAERGIQFHGGKRATRVTRRSVGFEDGSEIPADLVVWATGAMAPGLAARSGLPLDERGFLSVEDTLVSSGDPRVFAAGDCATLRPHPSLPKAGVYAVREGPVLAENLRRALAGQALVAYRPQPRFLSLLNTGDGRAILGYGPLAFRSRAAWWLKDAIDRRFVAGFRQAVL